MGFLPTLFPIRPAVSTAITEDVHILMKVETHNPTDRHFAFQARPLAPAAKSRDEGATGRAKPKTGVRLFGLASAYSRFRPALGAGLRQTGPHRLGAGHHVGRSHRRGGFQ